MPPLLRAAGIDWQESPAFVLHRGPYVVAAVLPSATDSVELTGRFIPLFDAQLPVLNHVVIKPNERQLLVDLDKLTTPMPCVVAASGRVSKEVRNGGDLSFDIHGIENTTAMVRIACDAKPTSVSVNNRQLSNGDWSFNDNVLRLRFTNLVTDQKVVVTR